MRRVVLLLEGRQEARACVVAHTLRVAVDPVALTWVDGDAAILDVDRADAWQALVVSSDSWTEPPRVLLWGSGRLRAAVPGSLGRRVVVLNRTRQQGVLHQDHAHALRSRRDHTAGGRVELRRRALGRGHRSLPLLQLRQPKDRSASVPLDVPNAIPDGFWAQEDTLSRDMMTSDWAGSQHIPSQHRLVAFYSAGSQLFSSVLTLDPTAPTLASWQPFAALEGTGAWAVNAPGVRDRGWLAYERPFDEDASPGPHQPRADRRLVQIRVTATGHVATVPMALPEGPHFRLAPVMPPHSPLPVDLQGSDAQLRARLGEIAALNPHTSAVGWAYLDEAFYLLPLHLALQLQRSGFSHDALREFRKLYDYGSATQRYTYPPLDPAGAATPTAYSRLADWLADPLDVHAIAAIRPGTAARAVLLALVRCLLDYGDSEFTQDTGEAITRARLLYRGGAGAAGRSAPPSAAERLRRGHRHPDPGRIGIGRGAGGVAGAAPQAAPRHESGGPPKPRAVAQEGAGRQRPWPERRDEAHAMIDAALAGQPKRPRTLLGALDEEAGRKSSRHWNAAAGPASRATTC